MARSHYCHRVSFSENEYVTIEYTSEPIRIRRVPKFGLCKQYDELPIHCSSRGRTKRSGAPCSQMMICEEYGSEVRF